MTLNICPTVLYALATVHLTFFYSSLRATSTIDMYTLKKATPNLENSLSILYKTFYIKLMYKILVKS